MNAVISPDGLYRYHLTRSVGPGTPDGGICLFVMLNPSTADATKDDPTIRRCKGFAVREGCSILEVVNLFAWRSSHPSDLRQAADPVGRENDFWIEDRCAKARIVIAAWGAHGGLHCRATRVALMLPPARTFTLGLTLHGQPKHPLYVPWKTPLVPFFPTGQSG